MGKGASKGTISEVALYKATTLLYTLTYTNKVLIFITCVLV